MEKAIREKVRELLVQNFGSKAHLIGKLLETEDFIKKNLFDSFDLIKVIAILEKEFAVTVAVADLANDRISSLEKIEQFVISKRPVT